MLKTTQKQSYGFICGYSQSEIIFDKHPKRSDVP